MGPVLAVFDRRFRQLHQANVGFVESAEQQVLESLVWFGGQEKSRLELVVRSAGKIEQTFGGLTSRLWDDPFEWTLPEWLSSKDRVSEYFVEAEDTRKRAFEMFDSDDVLSKRIPAPEQLREVGSVVLDTLIDAERLSGAARHIKAAN